MERKSENKIYRFMKIVEGEGNILRKNDLEEHLGKIDSIY